jgi:hypothetical protein
MNGRSEGAAWMEQVQHAVSGPVPAIIVLILSALLVLALLTLVARNRSLRLQLAGYGGGAETAAPRTAGAPLADPTKYNY